MTFFDFMLLFKYRRQVSLDRLSGTEKLKINRINIMKITNYAQQASKPDFFEANDTSIFASATAGSSPFNEWYEFENRTQAVNFMSLHFNSQSFMDRFEIIDSELYESEELFELLNEQFGEEHEFSEVIDDADLSNIEPACLIEAVVCESRF